MQRQQPCWSIGEAGDGLPERILQLANSGIPRVDFLTRAGRLLMADTASCSIELCVKEEGARVWFRASADPDEVPVYEVLSCPRQSHQPHHGPRPAATSLCDLAEESVLGAAGWSWTGTYWTGSSLPIRRQGGREGETGCHALAPLRIGEETTGWLLLRSTESDFLAPEQMTRLGQVIRILGIALLNQRAQSALRERVKELTCLYRLSQLAEQPGISLPELLQGIAELLPLAWQYPEIAIGRIMLDGYSYTSAPADSDGDAGRRLSAAIMVSGQNRGLVEVIYLEDRVEAGQTQAFARVELDEGPFLNEERRLINAIASQISGIIERRHTSSERVQLREQLLHADRLATIGQLSAGIAHELNEPLGAVLGFAQLAKKSPGMPAAAGSDISKIETAALHAREIVKKLMIFARQTPPRKDQINLNRVIEEGLYFLEGRCARKRIEVRRRLAEDLPDITADASQLQQVLVNLVVNAVQAMPDGGHITLATEARDDWVLLRVEDTGEGMSEEISSKIFLPFFTTKDVNKGTGLGLAVVHGIVTSHGGTIHVESEEGIGSCFVVELPVSPRKREEPA
jgi:signal transduction histidine kinase